MANYFDRFFESYNNNWVLLLVNALGMLWNVTVALYVLIYALVAYFILARPWPLYAESLWFAWVAAVALHAFIFFHYPGTVLDNIVIASIAGVGAALAGISWGYYWPYWINCFWHKSSLNSIQLETCLDANWLVMMTWLAGVFVTVSAAAVFIISLGNALFAYKSEKSVSRRI